MGSDEAGSPIPETTMVIYGGKKGEVSQSVESVLGLTEKGYYQTWVSLGVMRRLGFLFEGGVESSGGVGEIVCMFAVLIIVLALFAFWNLAVVFIVILVLTVLSGGAALKFLRATYVTASLDGIEPERVDSFLRQQVVLGRFVQVKQGAVSDDAQKSSQATNLFKRGIQSALLVATLFLIVEVIYWLQNGHWLSGLNPATAVFELQVLAIFGVLFALGVVMMDVGVVLRYRLSKKWAERVEVVD
jgi:hypothetical protein